jgi:DNA transformation protein and related proteins
MPSTSPYVEFLKEQFSPLGEITARFMFGGYALYCNGVIFALVADNALYLKADNENRFRFSERRLKAFKPFPDRDEVMSYYEAPPEIFEDADAMKDWCAASVEAGKRGAQKKPPKRPKPR